MGPLTGYRVIELAGIGPNPMACMILADLGAEVVIIDRAPGADPTRLKDISFRGKRSIALDLKNPEGVETLLKLVEQADVLSEGFRPGVAERLGIGPDQCLERNPKLIYARMTGWGQTGPLAHTAGHDINYISLTGPLYACGRRGERPVPPMNLVGDFGGGGMLHAMGILAALLEAQKSGQGQVIDSAMTDGSALLMWMMHSMHAVGAWNAEERGVNSLDGGAHFYDCYETADGKYISIGSLEPQFYSLLLDAIDVDKERFTAQKYDQSKWPALKLELEEVFKSKTQSEWCELMEGTDICFAPVLSFAEAPSHPHNQARSTYITVDDQVQPGPAPRFSRTPSEVRHGPRAAGFGALDVLKDYGFTAEKIAELQANKILL